MPNTSSSNDQQRIQDVEEIFQTCMMELKELHNEKLKLIQKFRAENNLTELDKIRKSLKSDA